VVQTHAADTRGRFLSEGRAGQAIKQQVLVVVGTSSRPNSTLEQNQRGAAPRCATLRKGGTGRGQGRAGLAVVACARGSERGPEHVFLLKMIILPRQARDKHRKG
jgi:hypothetical protein